MNGICLVCRHIAYLLYSKINQGKLQCVVLVGRGPVLLNPFKPESPSGKNKKMLCEQMKIFRIFPLNLTYLLDEQFPNKKFSNSSLSIDRVTGMFEFLKPGANRLNLLKT